MAVRVALVTARVLSLADRAVARGVMFLAVRARDPQAKETLAVLPQSPPPFIQAAAAEARAASAARELAARDRQFQRAVLVVRGPRDTGLQKP